MNQTMRTFDLLDRQMQSRDITPALAGLPVDQHMVESNGLGTGHSIQLILLSALRKLLLMVAEEQHCD